MARISVSPSIVKAGETVSITPYSMSFGEEYIISVSIGSYYDEFSGTYTTDPLVDLTVSYTVPSDASGTLECNIYLYNESGDPLLGGQGWYVADSAYATVEQSGFTIDYIGDISSYSSTYINTYQIQMYSYTPATSGTLTWYSSGSVDTYGWISSEAYCDLNSNGYPTSCISSNDDGAGNGNFSMTATVNAYTTYYLYARCCGTGSGSTTLYVSLTPPRPSNWYWETTVAQNSQIKLTAAEWNNFTARINQFRSYKGLSAYSFTTAVKNSTPIEAGICNQARTAIDAISGHGTLPTALVSGGTLYASFFNGLKNALNAIS